MKDESWGTKLNDDLQDNEELDSTSARKCRAVAARLNYILPDRPDIVVAVK